MAYDHDNLVRLTAGFSGQPAIFSYNADADSLLTVSTAAYFNDSVNEVATGDKIIISTTTANLSFSGTFRNDGTNVSIDFDNTLFFETQMSDISAATTSWISVPPAGVITQVYVIKWSAITVASSIITFSISSTSITGGAVTVTVSGAPGSKYSATPTALNITDGSTAVKAVSDGGATDAAIGTVGFKIICPAQI